jgi:hypothetical protein
MPAPRCPSIYKSTEDWVIWSNKYVEYKNKVFQFPPFEQFRLFKIVQHLGEFEIDRTWKYFLYLFLTERKHRTLTPYI